MAGLREYRRKNATPIIAVRLDLDTAGFSYSKWDGVQVCKAGDWIVRNGEDTYTVDADTFARTYREVSPGTFVKHASVWAERATSGGVIPTKEGSTAYRAGDMLVFNDAARRDGYAMTADRFEALYEPIEP